MVDNLHILTKPPQCSEISNKKPLRVAAAVIHLAFFRAIFAKLLMPLLSGQCHTFDFNVWVE